MVLLFLEEEEDQTGTEKRKKNKDDKAGIERNLIVVQDQRQTKKDKGSKIGEKASLAATLLPFTPPRKKRVGKAEKERREKTRERIECAPALRKDPCKTPSQQG